tara:strand:+ start:2373 stop:2600 length:228 start_codon:yes stop_codon:yes gene_type:complete
VGLDLLLGLVIPNLGVAFFICGLEEAYGLPIFLMPAMQLALRVSYSSPKRVKVMVRKRVCANTNFHYLSFLLLAA